MRFILLFVSTSVMLPAIALPASIPDDFPRFIVPNHQPEMDSIRALFWHHYQPAGPLIALWDEWMPMSTLWPATAPPPGRQPMRTRWAEALSTRPMNADGYILTQQHDGLAHAEGWPFPLWNQGGGIGWHFRGTGVPGYDAPLVKPEGWIVTGGKGDQDVGQKGWEISLSDPGATLQTPAFAVDSRQAPWLRLNWWASGLDNANCYVEWTTKDHPQFDPDRRCYFSPANPGQLHQAWPQALTSEVKMNDVPMNTDFTETRTMIPVYRLPGWSGTITGIRIHFGNSAAAKVAIKSFHTAFDSRISVNNINWIRGCHDYFMWARDITFLRSQIDRIRTAMHFTQREFQTQRRHCIYITWPGHDGQSGVRYVDGKKQIVAGEGIGDNYWDILPFGGEDALTTIYYFDALKDLADLEELIEKHPEWNMPSGADAFNPAGLRQHAQDVRAYGQKRFWDEKTGRFGTVDLAGNMHDYGFTFLNNEAVYYGFASPVQARLIHEWISGQRTVAGDTSTGADIYHWRFGPRSTTRRNIDYYVWGYSDPASIPFGYQVQDGGAVLGFSYHDLMARIMTAGPDDAATRLVEIAKWFDETQAAGGYRKYYEADPARGTMQGGNVAGGLGLDKEFFESVMVPQVMIYGFLGFHPTADGFRIDPKLPKDWPELTITRIALHDHMLDITAKPDGTVIVKDAAGAKPLKIDTPAHVHVQ